MASSFPRVLRFRNGSVGPVASRQSLDQAEQLVTPVALRPRVVDELPSAGDDGALLRRAGDRGATPAAELEETLVAKNPERPQHGVAVDAENGGEIEGRRKALARLRLPRCDRPAELGGHLVVQARRVVAIDLAIPHGAMHTSFIVRMTARRRRHAAIAGILLVVAGAVGYFASSGRPAQAARTVTLRLRGFGTPEPTTLDRGPCPQGRTLIPIVSARGRIVGRGIDCVLTIQKREAQGYGIRWIRDTATARYLLPGGTIETRERQVVRFARDQSRTVTSFTGRVVGGSGRYDGAHGTLRGGGVGVDGRALWTLTLHVQ